ncbi:hypothetical protein SAMN05216271_3193 [Halopseudomonas sabulinigri]|uniref:Uncharacterized protein n=1 Tax=Halopseudomonas sabulinigri TaxID=472181 RepID=A0A1H1WGH3_9GAMM|nr:hypothetical protein [Halopseudomonas sabulinigri]SDS95416.1 hypothetical protein SAMN05216271_3193 [Halopseudomonas sabulinigri]
MTFRAHRLSQPLGLLCLLLSSELIAGERLLVTPSYQLKMDSRCTEGEVSCAHYTLQGRERHSGEPLMLQGRSMHTTCADGETPCRFLGYRFDAPERSFLITEDGLLNIYLGDSLILHEQGRWEDEPALERERNQ